jgi:hypothetical protein
MQQIYDGNKRGKRPGHLFKPGSEMALCGFNKSAIKAPVIDAQYQGVPTAPYKYQCCKKCLKISDLNISAA